MQNIAKTSNPVLCGFCGWLGVVWFFGDGVWEGILLGLFNWKKNGGYSRFF